uniref:Peptidase M14 domain-containing protein n=1 Tax=Biomphalaria glabrata TaxID=6526 RepID=A0A2C9JPE9_BIOGL
KPEFKYIGNMHGNEVVGKEMLLYLMIALCEEYKKGDELAKFVVDQTRVHIMPSMNPDGWEAAYKEMMDKGEASWLTGRSNANGVDLNRNFPDLNSEVYEHEREHKGRNNHLVKVEKAITNDKNLQPETRAVMLWLAQIGFVLSVPLIFAISALPNVLVLRYLSKSYAFFHKTMADPSRLPCDKQGDSKPITNGGLWYSVAKDFLKYFFCVVFSVEDGDYYRLLADGYYHISAHAEGFHPVSRCVHIVNTIRVGVPPSEMSTAPELNFTLTSKSLPKPDNKDEIAECDALWTEVQQGVSA